MQMVYLQGFFNVLTPRFTNVPKLNTPLYDAIWKVYEIELNSKRTKSIINWYETLGIEHYKAIYFLSALGHE